MVIDRAIQHRRNEECVLCVACVQEWNACVRREESLGNGAHPHITPDIVTVGDPPISCCDRSDIPVFPDDWGLRECIVGVLRLLFDCCAVADAGGVCA
jgi:hypothetical protein